VILFCGDSQDGELIMAGKPPASKRYVVKLDRKSANVWRRCCARASIAALTKAHPFEGGRFGIRRRLERQPHH
jgi:hypothetical protein